MKVNPKKFEEEIARAMGRLPKFLQEASGAAGVAVLAEDRPPRDTGDQAGDALFAEFVGPTSAVFASGDSPHPPTVVLYRSTFESECDTVEEFREELYLTLIHELGHFLGFDEDELEGV